ncbi:hypothetical protein E1218_31410 [Kribbella turkmenica]|uniref:Uncharacterized protein n=1 Tax=Kribbella turkmenica TaxID=2530375 RepID=A0A4R4WGS4_9ACTN|nr:hypothetical protein [Kribbella turkmenica]TDD15464.1 hypothetical protein E1218_31410 [Kribbella turkmenica]
MTSEPDYEGPGFDSVPDDAPEADVLEQRQSQTVTDRRPDDSGVPIEADPADVDDQRREVGDEDEDDYR